MTVATQMTREEFYAKYGDVKVTFSSYYKYKFTYEATLPDGKRLIVGFGGDHIQIYRHSVSAGEFETVRQLQPYTGEVYEGATEVEGFHDF
jgi:hypothetical protein